MAADVPEPIKPVAWACNARTRSCSGISSPSASSKNVWLGVVYTATPAASGSSVHGKFTSTPDVHLALALAVVSDVKIFASGSVTEIVMVL